MCLLINNAQIYTYIFNTICVSFALLFFGIVRLYVYSPPTMSDAFEYIDT